MKLCALIILGVLALMIGGCTERASTQDQQVPGQLPPVSSQYHGNQTSTATQSEQQPQASTESQTKPSTKSKKGLEPCGDRKELFSVLPANMSQLTALTPVGAMSPPDHVFPAPHLYEYVLNFKNPKDIEIPVYAPGKMTLKHIGIRHYNTMGKKANYTDYTLVFSPCDGFDLYFHHLRSITYKPLYDAAQKVAAQCKFSKDINEDYCSGSGDVTLDAGLQFATAGDLDAGVWGFDLGARDYRIPNGRTGFLDPDRHCQSTGQNTFARCYTVCPFDYFTSAAQSQLTFHNAAPDSTQESLPCGGNMLFDINGTAQGYWFGKSEEGPSDFGPEHLNMYFGPNNLDKGRDVLSIGMGVPELESGLYAFTPKHSGHVDRDPSEVMADGMVYCYNGAGSFAPKKERILVQLVGVTTLRVGSYDGTDCGNGPWSLGEFTEYAR